MYCRANDLRCKDVINVKNGYDYLLVQDDNQLFHVAENGSFKHLMERPKRGSFDYYIFR